MTIPRALPRLTEITRAFWTGGEDGKLRISQCQDCKLFIHPPQPICRKCLSENVRPTEVAGTGAIDSFTINYQKWHPAYEVPYVIARVTIDGAPGVILTTNIVGSPVEDVKFGDKVKVRFEQHEDVFMPMFERVA